jgi:hypothetical protein
MASSLLTATYPLCPGTPDGVALDKFPEIPSNVKELPEAERDDILFLTEKNAYAKQKFLMTKGKVTKSGQSNYNAWYLATGKPDQEQTYIEFKVTFESRFGVSFTDNDHAKLVKKELNRAIYDKSQPKKFAPDGKEIPIPREPGYGLGGSLFDNPHMTTFCDVVWHRTRVEFSRNSFALNKGAEVPWEGIRYNKIREFAALSGDNKDNHAAFGKSFGFKIDADLTEFYSGKYTHVDPETKKEIVYDIPSSFEALWYKPGIFEVSGRFHKMNLETKSGTSTVLLATVVKYTAPKPKLGNTTICRNPIPKELMAALAASKAGGAAAGITAPLATGAAAPRINEAPDDADVGDSSGAPIIATGTPPTTAVAAPVSPTKDDGGVLGVNPSSVASPVSTSNKRAFEGTD